MELDQFRDVDLVIDRANDSFVQKQFVSQGDYKGRTLTVQVTNNGNVGEVPGLTLNLNWHNEASGLTDLTAFSVVNKASSVFSIEYPEHMMTPGKVYASIQIIQDGKVTNLKEFELTVQRLAGQAVGIVDKAEFSALVAVLADANQFRTDIDSLSIEKADKAAVLADSNKFRTDIEAVGNEINKTKSVLQTQIDTLVLQPGDSTAEVIQARNDNVGNSFATLNGRVSNIENIASKNIGIIPGGWVVGGLSNGLPITASNRLLSNYLDPINQEITVNCLTGYKFRIYYYTSKDVFATVGEWQNGKTTINTTYPFVRILLGKNDDTNVSIADAANIEMTKPAAPEEISNARYSKVLDIRYPEIGARFDYIDTSMSNMLEKEKYDLVWEIGGIGTTGINNTLTTRIRTIDFIDFQGNPIDVKIESDFKISVFEYNQNKEFVKYEWLTEAFSLETENKLYRFCIAKADDSNASIGFKEMVTFENQVATFKYLPQIQTLDREVALIKDKIGSSSLSGKKLSVMGDSISAFKGYIPSGNAPYYTGQNSGVSSYEQMWWQRICDQTGMRRLVINAWSGSKVSGIDASISNFVPMSDISRAQGLHTADDDPDIIIVFGGTNDFSKENADIATFEEAYHLMINRMQARYKSAKIYCLSLPIFVRTNTDKTGIEKNDEEKTVFDYNEVIRMVSNQRSCEYIDLNGCGITRQNMYPTYAIDYETIPTHPNSLGHDVYAKRILSRLLY